jgi:hypothetical protein
MEVRRSHTLLAERSGVDVTTKVSVDSTVVEATAGLVVTVGELHEDRISTNNAMLNFFSIFIF